MKKTNEKYEFHVENVNGVIKFTPETMTTEKPIRIIRFESVDFLPSSLKVKDGVIKCVYKGLIKYFKIQPVGTIKDVRISPINIDLKQFDLSDMPNNSKLRVVLFPTIK